MSDYRLTDEELSDLIDSPTINLFQRAYLTELLAARKALAERDDAFREQLSERVVRLVAECASMTEARTIAQEECTLAIRNRDTLREHVKVLRAALSSGQPVCRWECTRQRPGEHALGCPRILAAEALRATELKA